MRKLSLQEQARDIYLKTRNLTIVEKELKRRDYIISYSTLKRWKNESKWELWAEKYDLKLREFDEAVLSFEKEILIDLIDLSSKLKKKLKEDPSDSQLIYSYLGVVKQIKEFQKKESVDEGKIIDEVINALISDPVIGPVIQNRKKEVIKILQKK